MSDSTILRGIPDEQVHFVNEMWQEAVQYLFWIMHEAEVDDSGDGKRAFERAEHYDTTREVVVEIFGLLEQNGEEMAERLTTHLLHLAQIHAVETGYESGKVYSIVNIANDDIREGTEEGGTALQYALQMFASTTAERVLTQIQLELQQYAQYEDLATMMINMMSPVERGN